MNRPLPVVVCIVAAEGRVLLIKRARGTYRGLWGFPVGKVEFGEHLHDAAVREVREETGLEARFRGVLGHVSEHLRNGREVTGHYHLFVCKLDAKGEPKESEEGAVRWFPVSALAELELVPDVRAIMEEFIVRGAVGHYAAVVEKDGEAYALTRFERV